MSKQHSERFVTLVNDALTRVEEITPEEVQEKLDKKDDFRLIDVREREEWEEARIAGAEYLGKGVIERDIEEEADVDTEMVLYCGGGYRSALAADNLQKMGYRDVKSLKGGFRSWNEAGLPIEKRDH
ncbi:MAG: rhodanese-like domain-containing protein [Balneolaceae bacterium]|nr:rhodanese-like domain-containing protein [Balneolaceae bacterium]